MTCDACGRAFGSKRGLAIHYSHNPSCVPVCGNCGVQHKIGSRPQAYCSKVDAVCKNCERKYSTRDRGSSLCRHCSRPEPDILICSICEKQFQGKSGLNQHMLFHDDDFREKHSAATSSGVIASITDDVRQKRSVAAKEMWQRDGFRESQSAKIKAARGTEDSRMLTSKRSKEAWQNDKTRAKQSATRQQRRENGDLSRAASQGSKASWDNNRRKMLDGMRKSYSTEAIKFVDDPVFCRSFIQSLSSKPTLKEVSDAIKIPYSTVVRVINTHGLRDITDCSNQVSYAEDQVAALLGKFVDVERRLRSVIAPYELDIFAPEHSLAIELNGMFWHQEIGPSYHLNKTELCEEQSIRLIHVFEWELENPEKLSSLFMSATGKSKRIHARKCALIELLPSESRVFMESNHLQNNVGASYRLGLTYENELVAAMTFGKPRFSSFDGVELLRYCSKLGTTVVGGESKLFENAKKMYGFTDVISYCNRSKFTGKGYEAIGFVHTRNTPPSYWWVHKHGDVLPRYKTQMKDEVVTMQSKGYGRVYDCGNKVYEWHAKEAT